MLVFLFKAKRGPIFSDVKGHIKIVNVPRLERQAACFANPFGVSAALAEMQATRLLLQRNIVNWSVYRQDVAERLRLALALVASQTATAVFPRDLLR